MQNGVKMYQQPMKRGEPLPHGPGEGPADRKSRPALVRLEEPLCAEEHGARHVGMGHAEPDTLFAGVYELMLVEEVDHVHGQQQLLFLGKGEHLIQGEIVGGNRIFSPRICLLSGSRASQT